MTSLTFQSKVHFHQTRHGRKRMAVGNSPAPTSVPSGRVPRVSRLMALAIRFEDRSAAMDGAPRLAATRCPGVLEKPGTSL